MRLCCHGSKFPPQLHHLSLVRPIKLDTLWLTSSLLDLPSSYFSFSPKPIPDVSVSSVNPIEVES